MSLIPPQVQEKIAFYGAGFTKNSAVIALLDPAILPEYLVSKLLLIIDEDLY